MRASTVRRQGVGMVLALAALAVGWSSGCAGRATTSSAEGAEGNSAGGGSPGRGGGGGRGGSANGGHTGSPAINDPGMGFTDAPGTGGMRPGGPEAGAADAAEAAADGRSDAEDAPDPGASVPPAKGCAGAPYKLCEDFESGADSGLPAGWTTFKGYAAGSATDVVLATDQAHSGRGALKSESVNRGATRAQRSLAGLGTTAYHHWGRIFYKVDDPSPRPKTYLHTTFVSLIGPAGENRVVDSVEAPNGTHQWLFNVPSDRCCTSSGYNWRFDAGWHCAEWYVDAATHTYRFFSDAVEVLPLGFTGKANAPMSEYTTIVVGATFYQANGAIPRAFVVWFDDLAIDDRRVGCL